MKSFDDLVNKAQTLSDILSTPQTISFGDLCQIYSEYLCIDSLSNIEITLPSIAKVPASLQKFISNISKITFSSSVSAVFIVPISFAFLFCIVQLFLFIRETKIHLKQLHRGECEFVLKAKSINNGSICKYLFI